MTKKKILFTICSIIIILYSVCQSAYAANNKSIVNMVDMHEKESQHCEIITDNMVDSYGKSYGSNVFKMDASNSAYVIYDLDGQYSSFSGTLVASSGTGRGNFC